METLLIILCVFIVAFVAVAAYRSSFKLLQMDIKRVKPIQSTSDWLPGIVLVYKSGTKLYFVVRI